MEIRMGSVFGCSLAGVLILVAVISAQTQDFCYSQDDEHPQSAHMSSKTVYSKVKGPENGQQYIVPGCKPTKMWMYVRHGTRYSSAKVTKRLKTLLSGLKDEIIANYEKQHSMPTAGALCEDDLNLLKQWHWNPYVTEDIDSNLATQGYDELKLIAKRYQRAFPNILLDKYDSDNFLIRYSDCERTDASFKAFVEGLFGPNAHEMIPSACYHSPKDTLFKPHIFCPPFNNFNSRGENTEYGKFLKSSTMTQLISDVSQRLGYKVPLSVQQILSMYEMCSFDLAWELDKPSFWCAVFTPDQISAIEYLLDLDIFYLKSYGQKPAARLACSAVNDLIRHLDSNTNPKSVQLFAHSTNLVFLLTALHNAEDSEFIRADNYHNMRQRQWSLSQMSPFAANLAAVRYDCPNHEAAHEKVKFFLNEKPLELNWCQNGLCNLNKMKELLKEYTQANCDEYFCSGWEN